MKWRFLLLSTLALFVGCQHDPNLYSIGEATEAFHLSPTQPHGGKPDFNLVRVEPDVTVVIFVPETQEELSAKPGAHFLGKYRDVGKGCSVRTFGESGLTVDSSDPATQSAIVSRAAAWSR